MRTTLISYRALDRHPGRCYDYEFEDRFVELVGAKLIAPHHSEAVGRRHKDTLLSSPLSGRQDLLFVNVMSIWDLHVVSAIPGWRTGSRVTVCWIKEFFACTEIPQAILRVLQQFDLVILNSAGSVDSLQQRLPGTEVMPMPLGIDTMRFNPYPGAPHRGIDIYWVGRHDADWHEKFFALAEREWIHYQFNSGYADSVSSHTQHRALFSSMMKRTRLCIVLPAKFNDRETTGGQQEIGYRYFEGASAGAVLVGHAPQGASITELFPWPDAVVELPTRSAEVPAVVLELLARDDASQRRASVAHCLRHHDWAYRIQALLAKLGVHDAEIHASIEARCSSLQEQAAAIEAVSVTGRQGREL